MPDAVATIGTAETRATSGVSPRVWRTLGLAGVMVFLLAAFAVIEHDTVFANAEIARIAEDEIRDNYIDQLEAGNLLRQVALLSFGALGFCALLACRERPWNVQWRVAVPLLLLVTWTLLSVGWSGQPTITSKRLVVLLCILFGCAGLARLYRPGELLLCSWLTTLAFILGALSIDVAMGGRPWEGGDYRFGGTLHPNAQAMYCGVLCLGAFTQPIGFGKRWVLRLLFLFGAGLIVLTQSRTGLLSLVVAITLVWMLRLPSLYKWAGIGLLLSALATGFVLWNSVGDGARARTVDAALLGRTEQSKSLTGRVPLWEELIGYSSERPITGYGYEGFWTKNRIAAIMKSQNWTLQNAHNAYLEIVLQLGLVGLVLALWFLLGGVSALTEAYNLTREPGYAFAFGVVVFGMTNSLLESLFVKLRYSPVIGLTGLLAVALFFPIVARIEERHPNEANRRNPTAWLPSLAKASPSDSASKR